MKKKGVLGEGIIMIYRVFLVSFIALIVFGVSNIFYTYYLDVKDAEAVLLSRQVIDCLNKKGYLNISEVEPKSEKILDYCKIKNTKRFYVNVKISNGSEKLAEFYQGDKGKLWQINLYGESEKRGLEIKKYKPGYFSADYPILVIKDEKLLEGNLKLEVLVNDEV